MVIEQVSALHKDYMRRYGYAPLYMRMSTKAFKVFLKELAVATHNNDDHYKMSSLASDPKYAPLVIALGDFLNRFLKGVFYRGHYRGMLVITYPSLRNPPAIVLSNHLITIPNAPDAGLERALPCSPAATATIGDLYETLSGNASGGMPVA